MDYSHDPKCKIILCLCYFPCQDRQTSQHHDARWLGQQQSIQHYSPLSGSHKDQHRLEMAVLAVAGLSGLPMIPITRFLRRRYKRLHRDADKYQMPNLILQHLCQASQHHKPRQSQLEGGVPHSQIRRGYRYRPHVLASQSRQQHTPQAIYAAHDG